MTQTTFEDPDPVGGDRLNPKDCLGHLLMVWAVSYIDHSPTKFTVANKPSDVIVVDVVDLDQADEDGYQGKVFRSCWWRQSRLIGSLRGRIGRGPTLAWMAQGVATMGFPPFELRSANQDAEAVGRGQAWLAAHPEFAPGGRAPMSVQGMDIRTTVVEPEPVQPRVLSRLEQIAAQQADALRKVTAPLPPAPPPKQADDPPF